MANDLSYKYAVVPVLANAALLKAAPGLGDLNTYIKEITNLLLANDIPVPDLTLVYDEPMLPSTPALLEKVNTERGLDDSHGTLDHPMIKKVKKNKRHDESHLTMDSSLIKKVKTEKLQDESHVTHDLPFTKKEKLQDDRHVIHDLPLIENVKAENSIDDNHVIMDCPSIKKVKKEKDQIDSYVKTPLTPMSGMVTTMKASQQMSNTPKIQPCKPTDCGLVPKETFYKSGSVQGRSQT